MRMCWCHANILVREGWWAKAGQDPVKDLINRLLWIIVWHPPPSYVDVLNLAVESAKGNVLGSSRNFMQASVTHSPSVTVPIKIIAVSTADIKSSQLHEGEGQHVFIQTFFTKQKKKHSKTSHGHCLWCTDPSRGHCAALIHHVVTVCCTDPSRDHCLCCTDLNKLKILVIGS